MLEIQDLSATPPVPRFLNVDAIQDFSPLGEDRTMILMRNGSIHQVDMPYRAFKARLAVLLNRMLPLEVTVS
jgi:hypothetical protein